ncbi:MFS transporter [Halomarina ordinaria]|uniref:MFS transporter n=1 Tax=Halomarina ordinaria TaxID=3033939 RepID=A0ABD5UDR3_9EURY|nr:MFS transporter [Halomarina sp. PSRA2]
MPLRSRVATPAARQFGALYLTRFAAGFGLATLAALLPTYINVLGASGVVLGLFYTGFTVAQTAAVVPVAWAGDRYDKRTVLLVGLGLGVVAYGAFAFVETSGHVVLARALQGLSATATGILSLALVGELAARDGRANRIGRANAARLAAGVGGALSAGYLYQRFGFGAVYSVQVALMVGALLAVLAFVDPDGSRIRGNPFRGLALNRRLWTLTSFRAQYAVSVTLVRNFVPVYAGLSAARGGLGYVEATLAVSVVIVAEKVANMCCQPYSGTLSDRHGRALFVFVGGAAYGVVALLVPFTPLLGEALSLPATFPSLGELSVAFLPLVALNALLGVADSLREPASMALFADEGTADGSVASSFGVRELVWRPGSVVAPVVAGVLVDSVGIAWVFYLGGASALCAVATFLGVLSRYHGTRALTEW